MIARLRWSLLLATVAGLAAALWALGHAGWAQVVASAARVGLPGFLALCLLSGATFLVLGWCWLAGARGEPLGRLGWFAWGRATREAANDLLPFAQLGGVVVGVRTVLGRGASPIPVYAGLIVDMSTEMAAQLVFTLFALLSIGGRVVGAAQGIDWLLWSGLGLATALALAFFLLQRPALRLAAVLARKVLPAIGAMADDVEGELVATYAHRGRIVASFLLNLLAWTMTAFWSWIGFRLMGEEASLWHAAALESAIFALRSAAFLVPGALGVQEAGYALLAPLVAIDPAAALALSLVKRARDLVLGVPILLLWQANEMRGAVRPG